MRNRTGIGFRFIFLSLVFLTFSCSSDRDKDIAKVGENNNTVANVVDVMSSGDMRRVNRVPGKPSTISSISSSS